MNCWLIDGQIIALDVEPKLEVGLSIGQLVERLVAVSHFDPLFAG